MIKIDEKEMAIKLEETLTFANDVQPLIDNLKSDIEYDIEHDSSDDSLFTEEEKENMKKFLAYELTNEDKKHILEKIAEDYEYESEYHGDSNVTIFDEDGIGKAINDWIEEKFEFVY